MREREPLNGQVAMVTGAAQGIGRGIALVLAEAGARVVVGDLQDATGTVHAIEAARGDAVSMVMDVSRPDEANALVDWRSRPTVASTSWSTTPGSTRRPGTST